MNLYYAPVLGVFTKVKKRAFIKRVAERYLKSYKKKASPLKKIFSFIKYFLKTLAKSFNPNRRQSLRLSGRSARVPDPLPW